VEISAVVIAFNEEKRLGADERLSPALGEELVKLRSIWKKGKYIEPFPN
jgi:hypothetical protein